MVASMANRFPPHPTRGPRGSALLVAFAALTACSRGAVEGTPDAGAHTSSASSASAAAVRPGAPGDAGVTVSITAPLPEPVLGGILGCWQLGDLETWNITRTPQSGAQIVRTVSARGSKGMPADYVRRAAISSDIQYDASQARLAFDTAGPTHGLLFVFEVTPTGLAGTWYSARSTGTGNFRPTGNSSALVRCEADGGAPPG